MSSIARYDREVEAPDEPDRRQRGELGRMLAHDEQRHGAHREQHEGPSQGAAMIRRAAVGRRSSTSRARGSVGAAERPPEAVVHRARRRRTGGRTRRRRRPAATASPARRRRRVAVASRSRRRTRRTASRGTGRGCRAPRRRARRPRRAPGRPRGAVPGSHVGVSCASTAFDARPRSSSSQSFATLFCTELPVKDHPTGIEPTQGISVAHGTDCAMRITSRSEPTQSGTTPALVVQRVSETRTPRTRAIAAARGVGPSHENTVQLRHEQADREERRAARPTRSTRCGGGSSAGSGSDRGGAPGRGTRPRRSRSSAFRRFRSWVGLATPRAAAKASAISSGVKSCSACS